MKMRNADWLALLAVLALASPLSAKDRVLSEQWSGLWSEASGQHRCSVTVTQSTRPATLTLLCQLGADGVYYQGPMPAFGQSVTLIATRSDFGQAPAGHYDWGVMQLYAVCNEGLPEIIGTAYTSGAVADLRLHPRAVAQTGALCIKVREVME